MWTRYRVTWEGLNNLCGSVPADPEIVKAWVDARKPRVRPAGGKSITEINEEVVNSLARGEEFDETACNILGFQRHEGACVMRTATIKAHLKDCATVISNQFMGRIVGERAFSTRIKNGVYPDPKVYWTPILRPDGSPVTKHDDEKDKPVHIRGMSALKRFERIAPWRLDFTLLILTAQGDKPSVAIEDLETLMEYGGVHGYAGERGDGEGKYTFTLTKEDTHGDGSEEASSTAKHQRPTGSARVRVQPAARRQDRR